MKLLSPEMMEEMLKRAEADPELEERLKELSIRLLMVATDCPEGDDRQAELILEDGKFKSATVESRPAPSDFRTEPLDKERYDSKVLSPYDALGDLVQEKMSLVSAFSKVKIEGDLPKLMTQVEGFVALLQFIGSLPIEY